MKFLLYRAKFGIFCTSRNVANSALEALKKMSQATCTVVRDGQETTIQGSGGEKVPISLFPREISYRCFKGHPLKFLL